MGKVFDDKLLIDEYAKCKTCREVALKFGCSNETVRRALIRNNVPRVEKKQAKRAKSKKATLDELMMIVEDYYNSELTINDLAKKHHRSQKTISYAINEYGYGLKEYEINKKKVTDAQILEDIALGMTRQEIADKRGVNVANLDRRMHRLRVHATYAQSKTSAQSKDWHWTAGGEKYIKQYQKGFEFVTYKSGRYRMRCMTCGEIIERARSTIRQKHCQCDNCKEIKQLQEERIKLVRFFNALIESETPRQCVNCGVEFYSNNPHRFYCSDKCKNRKKKNGSYRKRARKYGVYYDASVTRKKIVSRDKCTCQICGGVCDPNDKRWGSFGPMFPTIDHIIPLAKGGTHTWSNCQCAHVICNSEKRDLITA